jgi:plastocyanin domain-containing protein
MKKALVVLASCAAFACSKHPTKEAPPPNDGKLHIDVTERGFKPDHVAVGAGKPVTIVFTRKTDNTCATDVSIPVGDGTKIDKELPLNQPVEVAVTFPRSGELTYACGMNMVKGVIQVQ